MPPYTFGDNHGPYPCRKENIRVLSIDGGGIRGIVPAALLAEIERRTQKPIRRLFDLLAGTFRPAEFWFWR